VGASAAMLIKGHCIRPTDPRIKRARAFRVSSP
jgi:hypothetical protein